MSRIIDVRGDRQAERSGRLFKSPLAGAGPTTGRTACLGYDSNLKGEMEFVNNFPNILGVNFVCFDQDYTDSKSNFASTKLTIKRRKLIHLISVNRCGPSV